MSSDQHDVHDLDRPGDGDDAVPGASGSRGTAPASFEQDLRSALRGVDGTTGARPLDLAAVRRRGGRRRAPRRDGSPRVPVVAVVLAAACTAGIVAVTLSVLPSQQQVGGPGLPPTSEQGATPRSGPTAGPTPTLSGVGPVGQTTGPLASGDLGTSPPSPPTIVVPLAPGQTFPPRDSAGWDPNTVAYLVPDLTTSLSALPAGVQLGLDLGQYRLEPTVPGQACGGPDPDTVAGRQWSWAEDPQSNDLDQVSVSLVVTGWPTGGGAGAFRDVIDDTGACRWMSDPAPAAVSVPGADEAWAASFADNGTDSTRGAARVGDLVVGVEVWNPPSGSTADVERLLTAVTAELAASGLPAASGR